MTDEKVTQVTEEVTTEIKPAEAGGETPAAEVKQEEKTEAVIIETQQPETQMDRIEKKLDLFFQREDEKAQKAANDGSKKDLSMVQETTEGKVVQSSSNDTGLDSIQGSDKKKSKRDSGSSGKSRGRFKYRGRNKS